MSKGEEKWNSAAEAERYLGRSVKITDKLIEAKKGTLGLKKLACVDFLCNFHKYVVKYT